jgi:hypothetical protein
MLFPDFRPAVTAPRCRNGRRVLLLISALLLTGCMTAPPVSSVSPLPSSAAVATTAPVVVAVPGVPGPSHSGLPSFAGRPDTPLNATALMLAFADRMRSLNSGELGAEISRMGEPGDSAPAQMQLAIALSATRVPADLARALGLLQRVIASQANDAAPIQPLARMLASRYLEQRRVEDDRDRQVQQLREAQRRIDQLNDRLEALRAIERSVTRPNNRPATVAPVPVPNP